MHAAMNVFTYGSLMFDEVWRRVVAGDYERTQATLADHRRFAVRGETYPGVIAMPGGRVDGIVYRDVSVADLARLDAFEGAPYQRRSVTLELAGAALLAEVYAMRDPGRLAATDWDVAAFAREGMHVFIATYCAQRGL